MTQRLDARKKRVSRERRKALSKVTNRPSFKKKEGGRARTKKGGFDFVPEE